jgi:hypothetical protein
VTPHPFNATKFMKNLYHAPRSLPAIGLAGNIFQFVDFSSKIVCKAKDIYRSADGCLSENTDAETVAKSLRSLNFKIKDGLDLPSTAQKQALKDLCIGCDEVAQELIGG